MSHTRRTFLQSSALAAAGAAFAGKSAFAREFPVRHPALHSCQELGDRFDLWIEVEAGRLTHNVAEIRRLSADRPILAVVKNNAYGLDVTTTAALLEPMPEIVGFAVVKAEAAIALKEAGVRKSVYLMALFSERMAPELARHRIVPCLYSDDALRLIEPTVRTTVAGSPGRRHFGLPPQSTRRRKYSC